MTKELVVASGRVGEISSFVFKAVNKNHSFRLMDIHMFF